jgi:hypothetical protein
LLVARKHSRFGLVRFKEAIAQAVATLGQFKEAESARIKKLMVTEVTDDRADALILRGYEAW